MKNCTHDRCSKSSVNRLNMHRRSERKRVDVISWVHQTNANNIYIRARAIHSRLSLSLAHLLHRRHQSLPAAVAAAAAVFPCHTTPAANNLSIGNPRAVILLYIYTRVGGASIFLHLPWKGQIDTVYITTILYVKSDVYCHVYIYICI